MENTYNWFLYAEYYFRRLSLLLRSHPAKQVGLVTAKARSAVRSSGAQIATPALEESTSSRNPMRVYFPGPDFVPKTYAGRVSVFRARRQPLNRIRDKELGWGKLAVGGVDLHYVPGKHGASVLREPHVRVLADELKHCLLDAHE
jgi:hypothetical protein